MNRLRATSGWLNSPYVLFGPVLQKSNHPSQNRWTGVSWCGASTRNLSSYRSFLLLHSYIPNRLGLSWLGGCRKRIDLPCFWIPALLGYCQGGAHSAANPRSAGCTSVCSSFPLNISKKQDQSVTKVWGVEGEVQSGALFPQDSNVWSKHRVSARADASGSSIPLPARAPNYSWSVIQSEDKETGKTTRVNKVTDLKQSSCIQNPLGRMK